MHKKRAETADMEMTEMLLNLALRGTETDEAGWRANKNAIVGESECPTAVAIVRRLNTVGHSVGQRLILPKTAEGAAGAGGGRSIEYNRDCGADPDFVSGRSKVRHRPQQPRRRRCYVHWKAT